MKLSVEIKPDFHGSISITDYTQELDEYIPEDADDGLLRYYNFKYSLTCTINILKYISVKLEELVGVYYSTHDKVSDSIRVDLPRDGFYSVLHLVLPTLEWLEMVKGEDLSEYNFIYVTDGYKIYKYFNGELYEVEPLEVTEVNPYKTTISILNFLVFSIDRLKHCYVSVSRQIMDNYVGKCASVDDTLKFNRDFLWMTLNVIEYYLEWGKYSQALIVLEDLRCHQFCPDTIPFKNEHVSCGCRK